MYQKKDEMYLLKIGVMSESLYFWIFMVNLLVIDLYLQPYVLKMHDKCKSWLSIQTTKNIKAENPNKPNAWWIVNDFAISQRKSTSVYFFRKSPQSISYFHLLVSIGKVIGDGQGVLKARASDPGIGY